MQLFNIDYIPGKEFEALGLVKGTVVQSKNIGRRASALEWAFPMNLYPTSPKFS